MTRQKITISAEVEAKVKKVWDYWTEAGHIVNWNFASDDWQCPSAENDLRIGGKYSARMEAKDGSFGFDFVVVYDEIIDLQRISYTMEDGRQATTTFEDKGPTTIVTTKFDAEEQNPIDLQQAGWQSILNNFKKYCENN